VAIDGGSGFLPAPWPTDRQVILADEPTTPLDSERALAVMRILNQMASQYQTTIIVVTHDEKIIPTFKRIYTSHCHNHPYPVRPELVEGSMCFDKLSTNGSCRLWRFLVYLIRDGRTFEEAGEGRAVGVGLPAK